MIVSEDLDNPHALAIDYSAGLLFWTNNGKDRRIERSGLDGSDRKIIVNADLGTPSGLAADPASKMLYWCDSELAVIVGVSSAHRSEAFAACRYIIDEVKHRVPIWKKEHYEEGDSGWINCEQCASAAHADH